MNAGLLQSFSLLARLLQSNTSVHPDVPPSNQKIMDWIKFPSFFYLFFYNPFHLDLRHNIEEIIWTLTAKFVLLAVAVLGRHSPPKDFLIIFLFVFFTLSAAFIKNKNVIKNLTNKIWFNNVLMEEESIARSGMARISEWISYWAHQQRP